MFRAIKWLLFLAIVAGVVLYFTGTKIGGKTVQEYLEPITGSKAFKEGVHDVRSIVGEGLKAAGEAISEDVTTDERKQLDDLVKKELQTGKPVEMAPGQTALPPTPQAAVPVSEQGMRRPTTQQMQTMPKPAEQPAAALPAAPVVPAAPVAQPAPAAPEKGF